MTLTALRGWLGITAGLVASLIASAAFAQHEHGDAPAGASQGVVAFENSGAAAAQADFLRGLAQLHNFQYDAAAASFRRARDTDPGFAMAYWGEAMTHNHPIWAQQNLNAARTVMRALGDTPEARRKKAQTDRERAYLDTLEVLYGEGDKFDRDRRYALAMERLHAAYPDDVDATCFYALALLGTAHAGRDVTTYMRSAALMEEVFERYPQHPGAAHYLIHSVDDAAHAPLGLRAANAYAKIAPDSSHAQHMTSHIYLALGMWAETAAANEAAIAVGQRSQRGAGTAPPRAGCGHSVTWLHYAYLQQGRTGDARVLLDGCSEEARGKPRSATGADALDYDDTSVGSFYEMRSRQLIDAAEGNEAVAKPEVPTTRLTLAEYTDAFTSAYQALRAGKPDVASDAIARTRRASASLTGAAEKLGIPAAHPRRRLPPIEVAELEALRVLRKGDKEAGVAALAKVAAEESGLPMDFGPPSLHKPANELLGEMLLELGRPAEARAAFEEAQRLAPGRVQSLAGLAQCAKELGDKELAASTSVRLANAKRR